MTYLLLPALNMASLNISFRHAPNRLQRNNCAIEYETRPGDLSRDSGFYISGDGKHAVKDIYAAWFFDKPKTEAEREEMEKKTALSSRLLEEKKNTAPVPEESDKETERVKERSGRVCTDFGNGVPPDESNRNWACMFEIVTGECRMRQVE
ncbi:hypothetical protein C8R45DRAFT_921234 [Mycena sanguinolenta]|nr:hypothetical protein C8R45DRAFT_921234 [Mycena sanguinolenta]